LKPMKGYLNGKIEVTEPEHTPVYGAYRIAKERFETPHR